MAGSSAFYFYFYESSKATHLAFIFGGHRGGNYLASFRDLDLDPFAGVVSLSELFFLSIDET
jgi:hypothetical protein